MTAVTLDLLNGSAHGTEHGKQTVAPIAFANNTFSHLKLYTGNTMRTGTTGLLNTSLKKSNQELVAAIQDTLLYSLDSARVKGDAITIRDETSVGPLEGDRATYEITAKLFYLSRAGAGAPFAPLSVEQLGAAVQDLETAVGIDGVKIDHFILSLPNQSFDENGQDEAEVEAFTAEIQQSVLPVWKKLSEWRQQGRIGRLGVSEFSKQQLEILKAVAEKNGLSVPEVNQVNLTDCCVLPKDLISYSKEQGVELLTHGDSTDILPKSTFSSLLQSRLSATAATSLAPNFVLKYSAFITSRGLITKKGYIVDASV